MSKDVTLDRRCVVTATKQEVKLSATAAKVPPSGTDRPLTNPVPALVQSLDLFWT